MLMFLIGKLRNSGKTGCESPAHLSHSLEGCTMFEQQLHHSDSVLLTGNMKRSETILSKRKEEKRLKLLYILWF